MARPGRLAQGSNATGGGLEIALSLKVIQA
jgi:hypothetical protein